MKQLAFTEQERKAFYGDRYELNLRKRIEHAMIEVLKTNRYAPTTTPVLYKMIVGGLPSSPRTIQNVAKTR